MSNATSKEIDSASAMHCAGNVKLSAVGARAGAPVSAYSAYGVVESAMRASLWRRRIAAGDASTASATSADAAASGSAA